MKKVALTIQNGIDSGRVLWVRLDQVIEVGSSDSVDFPVTGDAEMAPLHFEIRHHRYGCFVEAFNDDLIFKINDRDISRKRLHDGDVLQAGQTRFVAEITGDHNNGVPGRVLPSQIDTVSANDLEVQPGESATDIAIDPADVPNTAVDNSGEAVEVPANRMYHGQSLAADVWLYQPESAFEFQTAQVIEGLNDDWNLFCVVDRDEFSADSLQAEQEIDPSRVLVQPSARDAIGELFSRDNTAILVITDRSIEEVIQSIRLEPFSFGQPSVLSTQVSMGTNSMVEKLMRDKVGVLVSDPHVGWQLFSKLDLARDWEQLGFDRPPAIHD